MQDFDWPFCYLLSSFNKHARILAFDKIYKSSVSKERKKLSPVPELFCSQTAQMNILQLAIVSS